MSTDTERQTVPLGEASQPLAIKGTRRFGSCVVVANTLCTVSSDFSRSIDEIEAFAILSDIEPTYQVEISLSSDPILVKTAIERTKISAERVHAKHDIAYLRYEINGGATFVSDIGYSHDDAFAIVQHGPTEYSVHVAKPTASNLRTPLRLAREVALRQMELGSARLYHAAAVVANGSAWLICGRSGAGKTTLASAALSGGSSSYLSNDKCIIRENDGVLTAYNWPVPVRIGNGTVKHQRWAADLQRANLSRASREDLISRMSSGAMDASNTWGSKDKVELTTKEYCSVVGCLPTAHAPIAGVIEVNLSLGNGAVQIERLSAAEAATVTSQSWMADDDPDFSRDWLGLWRGQERCSIGRLNRVLADRPTYRLRAGVDSLGQAVRVVNELFART